VRASANGYGSLLVAGLSCAVLFGSGHAASSADCKPSHPLPTIVLTNMGECAFDPASLVFSGTPAEQAMCLMRGMDLSRNLAPPLHGLPGALENRIGRSSGLPTREALSMFLSKQDLEWSFAAYLWQPVSRANDNDAAYPAARYFVIHDTSGPNYGRRSFPDDIDTDPKLNNLDNFVCSDGWGRAHVVVNRSGGMLVSHDFAIPWRQTKFERAINFNGALKGLFLHVELIQPRRTASGHGWRNDAQTPDPAFTAAQYDRLALLYVVASVRADRWLIPVFHAALDADIPNGHDDPLNFDVQSFANSLDALIEKLNAPAPPAGAAVAAAGDAQAADPAIPPNAPWVDAQWDHPPRPAAAASAADATARPEPMHAMVALHDQESSGQRETATAEHCQTRIVKGHHRRLCDTARAESRERGKHLVRSVDRHVSRQGDGARRHRGNLHGRHERTASRHDGT